MKDKIMEMAHDVVSRDFQDEETGILHRYYYRAMEIFDKEVYYFKYDEYYYCIYEGKIYFRLHENTKLLHRYIFEFYAESKIYTRLVVEERRRDALREEPPVHVPMTDEELSRICEEYVVARKNAEIAKKNAKKDYHDSTTKAKFKLVYNNKSGANNDYLTESKTVEEAFAEFYKYLEERYPAKDVKYCALVMKYNGREIVLDEKSKEEKSSLKKFF